MMDICK
jgi:hypothetical protein